MAALIYLLISVMIFLGLLYFMINTMFDEDEDEDENDNQ